jgi:biopolymer transport protein ExbD
MKFRRRNRIEIISDMTPLIDVVFQLIIFFMLTSSFVMQPGIKVNLPEIVNIQNLPAQRCEIRITADDRIFVGDGEVAQHNLNAEMLRVAGENRPVAVLSDRGASFGVILSVWDACQSAGIRQLGFSVLPKPR